MDNFDLSLFINTGNSVYNDEIRKFISKNISDWFADSEIFSRMDDSENFLRVFDEWIQSSELNSTRGLDSFIHRDASLGVTQSLDQFHYDILAKNRRLRVFRGEYPYSRDVHPFSYEDGFIDDHPLEENDAVILSCPFSGSGSLHPKTPWLLNECSRLGVPVFIDMAWFGTCAGIDIDLSHPAITQVAFSLTKGLTCGNYRCGIRYSKEYITESRRDRLNLQTEWNHGVHLNQFIGINLMHNFSPDYHFQKFRPYQIQVCKEWDLTPSHCVHIATSTDPKWKQYERDGAYLRINLREAIKKQVKAARKSS